jgi:hypothetical protein
VTQVKKNIKEKSTGAEQATKDQERRYKLNANWNAWDTNKNMRYRKA